MRLHVSKNRDPVPAVKPADQTTGFNRTVTFCGSRDGTLFTRALELGLIIEFTALPPARK